MSLYMRMGPKAAGVLEGGHLKVKNKKPMLIRMSVLTRMLLHMMTCTHSQPTRQPTTVQFSGRKKNRKQ